MTYSCSMGPFFVLNSSHDFSTLELWSLARTAALKMSWYALVRRPCPSASGTCSTLTLRSSRLCSLLPLIPLANHIGGYAVDMPVGILRIEAVKYQKGACLARQGEFTEKESDGEAGRASPGWCQGVGRQAGREESETTQSCHSGSCQRKLWNKGEHTHHRSVPSKGGVAYQWSQHRGARTESWVLTYSAGSATRFTASTAPR